MTSSKSHLDELEGRLHDAVAAVRGTPVDDSMIERCRQSAVELGVVELGQGSDSARRSDIDDRLSWQVLVILAATILLLINVAQAYARLPSSSRELAAIQQSAGAGRFYIYSDLRIELASSDQTGNFRSEP